MYGSCKLRVNTAPKHNDFRTPLLKTSSVVFVSSLNLAWQSQDYDALFFQKWIFSVWQTQSQNCQLKNIELMKSTSSKAQIWEMGREFLALLCHALPVKMLPFTCCEIYSCFWMILGSLNSYYTGVWCYYELSSNSGIFLKEDIQLHRGLIFWCHHTRSFIWTCCWRKAANSYTEDTSFLSTLPSISIPFTEDYCLHCLSSALKCEVKLVALHFKLFPPVDRGFHGQQHL